MFNRKAAALISLTAPSLQQAYARSLGRCARRVLCSGPISEARDLPEQSIDSSSSWFRLTRRCVQRCRAQWRLPS
jgi:hypothetical protein